MNASPPDPNARILVRIKVAHTFFWAVFASATVAIPIATALGLLTLAVWLSGLVWIECLILFANRMRCPLTKIAERHTGYRSDNFAIFLPAWLARYNLVIFGSLFAASEIYLLIRLLS